MLLPLQHDQRVGAIRTEWQTDGSVKVFRTIAPDEGLVVHLSVEEAGNLGYELMCGPNADEDQWSADDA